MSSTCIKEFQWEARVNAVIPHFWSTESSSVLQLAVQNSRLVHVVWVSKSQRKNDYPNLSSEQLDHLSHCHARRKSVGVHDGIYFATIVLRHHRICKKFGLTWVDTLIVEGHIFLINNKTTNAFLSVSRGELIAQLRPPCLTDEDLDQCLVVVSVTDHDFVNIACDGRLVSHGGVFVGYSGSLSSETIIIGVGWRLLVDIDVARVDPLPNSCKAIFLNDIIFFGLLTVLIERSIR